MIVRDVMNAVPYIILRINLSPHTVFGIVGLFADIDKLSVEFVEIFASAVCRNKNRLCANLLYREIACLIIVFEHRAQVVEEHFRIDCDAQLLMCQRQHGFDIFDFHTDICLKTDFSEKVIDNVAYRVAFGHHDKWEK